MLIGLPSAKRVLKCGQADSRHVVKITGEDRSGLNLI